MAIYHCSVKIIGRSNGRSATGAAAYRSGEKIIDERSGIVHDYTRKSGIDHTEIFSPENTPDWMKDRQKLWNHIEHIEKRKDSQLCREVEVALPCELTPEENLHLVRGFIQSEFTQNGMVADLAIHHTQSENPHAHILLTTRELTSKGFGKKNRSWNEKSLMESWRVSWAHHTNQALERHGHDNRVDHRTLEAQGIERIPQIHLGPNVHEMEKRGIRTDRGERALAIENTNEAITHLQEYKEALEHERNIELEKSTNTRRSSEENRTHGASTGDTIRSSNNTLGRTENSKRNTHKTMDRSTNEHSERMGNSSEERTKRSFSNDQCNEPRHTLHKRMEIESDSDLLDQFDHAYSGALDRIVDLARPADYGTRGGDMAHHENQRGLDRTYLAVRRQLQAMGANFYEIGIKTAKGMLKREWSIEQVLKSISWLKRENAKGADIYVRPAGDQNNGIILVDDINQKNLNIMKNKGFEPATVVETSPFNYQAWIRLSQSPLDPKFATALSKGIANCFEADPNSADWRHFGRLAGFTNRKPEHKTAQGRSPWVLCHESSGRQASQGENFVQTISKEIIRLNAEQEKKHRLESALKAPQETIRRLPIPMYQNNLKGLQELYGADMDLSRADFMICSTMALHGFSKQQIHETLLQASPELAVRKANHEADYCKRTVDAVFASERVQNHLKTQSIKKHKERAHGFSR